jgi:uncharacterized membrane protein YjfL (UPF0719 family)
MMSADDAVLTGAAILGASSWLVWLRHMLKVRPLDRRAHPSIAILGLTLLACTAVILAVLNTAASYDVVDAPVYQFMYLVIGLTWLRLAHAWFPYLGISPRDDAVERGNLAAASVSAGALLAVALCYAGANVGNGPGWWVVLFSAALATGTLFILWAIVALLTPVTDAVIVDRDRAAAIRFTAFLISCGVIAGRGVARLGLPSPVRRALRAYRSHGASSEAARLMRFDFHFSEEGWRISEVNCDVPGGLNEASGFPAIIESYYRWARAIGALVALCLGRATSVSHASR